MLLEIKDNEVKVLKEKPGHEETPPVCEALHRVKDELGGFLEYKGLERKYSEKHAGVANRYTLPRLQECMHMFMALDDFFTELKPLLSPEEMAEFHKWKKSLDD